MVAVAVENHNYNRSHFYPSFPIQGISNQVLRGDVYWVNFKDGGKNVQAGVRPALVIQNDVGNRFSPTVIVFPISTKVHKAKLPTHVIVPKEFGFDQDSYVMCEQIRTVSKEDLGDYIAHLDEKAMRRVDNAALVSIGIVN